MTTRLSVEQVRGLWLRGQGILGLQPAGLAATMQVARQACGLQAQDIFAATLGVRVRSAGATFDQAEQARCQGRDVIWTWAMRGTLHLVAAEDVDWLLAALGPLLVAAGGRRRQQLGLDEDTYARGLRAICDYLAANGPATREELGTALAAAGLPAGYPIERHLLYRAALEGIICMGPDRGTRPTFVLLEDWLGRRPAPVAAEAALGELARRYLAAYAPATPADLAAWSGLPMARLRAGWEAVAGELVEVTVDGRPAWLPQSRLGEVDSAAADAATSVRLLPAFDTYLLGHRSRDLIVEPAHAGRINAGGGMIRAALLVAGQVAGTWLANRKGRRLNLTLERFAALPPTVEAGIAGEMADLQRFLGLAPAGNGRAAGTGRQRSPRAQRGETGGL